MLAKIHLPTPLWWICPHVNMPWSLPYSSAKLSAMKKYPISNSITFIPVKLLNKKENNVLIFLNQFS